MLWFVAVLCYIFEPPDVADQGGKYVFWRDEGRGMDRARQSGLPGSSQ